MSSISFSENISICSLGSKIPLTNLCLDPVFNALGYKDSADFNKKANGILVGLTDKALNNIPSQLAPSIKNYEGYRDGVKTFENTLDFVSLFESKSLKEKPMKFFNKIISIF
jgi:hypothetical protein